jgi:hypothetical protein
MGASRSPAGPMQATRARGSVSARSMSSVSKTVRPQRWSAGRSSTRSSFTQRYTGRPARPSKMNRSKPVRFISVGKKPPELEQEMAPVRGDLVVTMYRLPVGTGVAVRGPVEKTSLFSGERGSTRGSISL